MESENTLRLERGELVNPATSDSSSSSSSSSSSAFSSFYFAPPPASSSASSGEELGQLTLQLACDVAQWQQMGSAPAEKAAPGKTLLILVVDESGSMYGPYERQVVPAMIEMMEQSYLLPHMDCEIILYNSSAQRLNLTPDNYRDKLKGLTAGGGTSFNSAFNEIGKLLTEKVTQYDDVVVGFLTDGQDSSGRDSTEYRALQAQIRATEKRVVVHSLAFTSSHDFDFLNAIRRDLGTVEGGFQYAEPGDGAEALRNKLQAIFETVSVKLPTAEFVITAQGYEFVSDDETTTSSELRKTFTLPTDGSSIEVFSLTKKAPSSAYSFSGAASGEVQEVRVEARLQDHNAPALRHVFQVLVKTQDKGDSALAGLRRVTGRITALQTTIADAATNNKVTDELLTEWQKSVKDLQKHMEQYQGVPMLLLFKKHQRASVFQMVNEVNGKLNAALQLVTQLFTNKVLTTAMKARLAEITYGHQFQSASRGRRLNERAGKNAAMLVEAEEALKAVEVDKAAVDAISDELAEHYRCILSQSNWKDLVLEQDRDVVGFGVALSRPETAVDDPTQVRIVDISISPVSKSSFEDALAYSISTEGHIQAHGGFAHNEADLGVAVRGMGREPINAWVPLFIHPQHWKLVFPQLKGVMGYLATLDPLGYNPNQVDLFYMILATMVSRLSSTPGEKELSLVFAMQRTCAALTAEFPNVKGKLVKLLKAFVSTPEARLKDQTKNLLVLVGYLLSLPANVLDEAISGSREWLTFWLHLLNESVRRGSESICRSKTEDQVSALVDAVVSATSSLPAEQVAAHLFCSTDRPYVATSTSAKKEGSGGVKSKEGADEGEQAPATPAAAAAPTPSTPAPAQTSTAPVVPNAAEDEAIKRLAQQLMYGARDSALPDLVADKPRLELSNVSSEMLEALLQFGKDFNQRGHPSLSALISLATFTHSWLSLQKNAGSSDALLAEIDNNGGVAPNSWIVATKNAFKDRAAQPATFASCFRVLEQVTGCEVRSVACHDWLVVVRAMTAQGVRLRVNKDCREAIEQGKYLDPVVDAERVLENYFTEMLVRREKEGKQNERKSQLSYAIQRCIDTDDIAIFVGYLVSRKGFEGKRNTQAFRELYLRFQHATDAAAIPLGAEKLRILLTA